MAEQEERTRSIIRRGETIPEAEIPALVAEIQARPDLLILDLSKCGITDDGAVAIAEAVAEHPSLYKVDLSRNPFWDKGGVAVIDAARVNPSVQMVDVSSCGITEELPRTEWGLGNPTVAAIMRLVEAKPDMQAISTDEIRQADADQVVRLAELVAKSQISEFNLRVDGMERKGASDVARILGHSMRDGQNVNLVRSTLGLNEMSYRYTNYGPLEKPVDAFLLGYRGDATQLRAHELGEILKRPQGAMAELRKRLCRAHGDPNGEFDPRIENEKVLDELFTCQQSLRDYLAILPPVDIAAPIDKDALFAPATEIAPLDDPRVWAQLPEIIETLNRQGTPLAPADLQHTNRFGQTHLEVAAECGQLGTLVKEFALQGETCFRDPSFYFDDEGKARFPLWKGDTVSAMFSLENWEGATMREVRQLYNALPERFQNDVTNLHTLNAALSRGNARVIEH